MKTSFERAGVALAAGAGLGCILWPALTLIGASAGLALAVITGLTCAAAIHRVLPASLDGAWRRRPWLASAWMLLALVTLVQTARLGAYVADPSQDWWHTTRQEFWSRHACMAAYFYAADLNRQGEPNVYDPTHYPGLNPEAENHATLDNFTPDDPYQYPPQFLLLPHLAMSLSNDFEHIRPVWYALQALLFLTVTVWMARALGGNRTRVALWLLPAVWLSVPSILNFQYGQFHVSAICLGVAAALAVRGGRDVAGGALLAAAILTKGFPGILLLPLLMQRRWGAVVLTGAWSLVFTLLAVGVLGTAPFTAFVTQHLPRLMDGSAFAFDQVWPEFKGWLLAGNVSPFAAVRKLSELLLHQDGITAARGVQALFTLMVAGLGLAAGRVRGERAALVTSLALLNLAAMTSPAAWGDYVPVGTLWLVTLLAAGATGRWAATLATVGGLCFLLPGVVPVGNWPDPTVAMGLSVVTTLALIAMNGGVVLRPEGAGSREASRRSAPAVNRGLIEGVSPA